MPTIVNDIHRPTFVLFPMNNDRTAWRPYGTPAILVVPHRRSVNDISIPNSQVFNVRVAIENVPRFAYVAGHDHIGLKFPEKELYGIDLDSLRLSECLIDIRNGLFYRDGVQITYAEAVTGDLLDYTTASGVHDTITYIQGADYYDLSNILIEVETLPSSTYNLAYTANYYNRIVTRDGLNQFICIDVNTIALTLMRSQLQHPGKVMEEFYRSTPVPYLTNSVKSADTTVGLYRPFTDILQDLMDEQDILERVNWVYDCPIETIPYLSSLLGWDLPYFPRSLDSTRRAILRRTVELQQLKGSRRAIIDIFKIFGYNILITNLWWSSDGKRLIRPDERLPVDYANQQIKSSTVYQFDLLLSNYSFNDFEVTPIPLTYRPQVKISIDDFDTFQDNGPVTIDAYAVKRSSPAFAELIKIANEAMADPSEYGQSLNVILDDDGYLNATAIHNRLNNLELHGYSQILLSGSLGLASDETLVGEHPPLRKSGVILNRDKNVVTLTLNGYFDPKDDIAIFAFAVFGRADYVVPETIRSLQSNRFAIQVLTPDLTEYADPITLDFALEFVYKIKAFHSLLYVVRTRLEASENYEVTDLLVGGDYNQRYDTDIGRLQVPPAIIPNVPSAVLDCALLDARNLGYKDTDERLRILKLKLLIEDYNAWKSLDDREVTQSELLRLLSPQKAANQSAALYNYRGQDRITTAPRVEELGKEYTPSPNSGIYSDPPTKYAINNISAINGYFNATNEKTTVNLNGSGYGPYRREFTAPRQGLELLDGITDFKYKGRVDDEVLHQTRLVNSETYRPKGCSFSLGLGVYYAFPSTSLVKRQGVAKPERGSLTGKMTFTGGAPSFGLSYYKEGIQGSYLTQDKTKPPVSRSKSFLGSLYVNYDTPIGETIHLSNRISEPDIDQRYQLAIMRPSLDIVKPNLNLPGCRFPTLHALQNDYVSDVYTARPWDDENSTGCGEIGICGNLSPTYLNYFMINLPNGDEKLTYDTIPFAIAGNGLLQDINSLGDHALITGSQFTEEDVIHKVYMANASSNPAVTLDQVCDYDTSTMDGAILTDDVFFNSYSPAANSQGYYTDYANGYPCLRGSQPYTPVVYTNYGDVLAGLGLSTNGTNAPVSYLFTLGSGIHIEHGYRLDCGCSVFGYTDDTTVGDINDTICSTSIYKDQDGHYDWNNDHLRMMPYLSPYDSLDVASVSLNGSIPTLLETI